MTQEQQRKFWFKVIDTICVSCNAKVRYFYTMIVTMAVCVGTLYNSNNFDLNRLTGDLANSVYPEASALSYNV